MRTKLFKIKLDLPKDDAVSKGAIWLSPAFDKLNWQDQISAMLKEEGCELHKSSLAFVIEDGSVYAIGEANVRNAANKGTGYRTTLAAKPEKKFNMFPDNDILR